MSNGFSKGLERLRIAQVIGGLWEGRLSAKTAIQLTNNYVSNKRVTGHMLFAPLSNGRRTMSEGIDIHIFQNRV